MAATPSAEDGMLAAFPDSPAAERARFLRARKGKLDAAVVMLRDHLAWRASTLPPPQGTPLLGKGLPLWNTIQPAMLAVDGTRVLLTLAAMCDPEVATPEEYALAAAVLIDESLPRDEEQFITIVVDVGGVKSGANAAPKKLFSVIRELSRVLSSETSERPPCLSAPSTHSTAATHNLPRTASLCHRQLP